MKVNMTPNPLDVVTIHASQGDTEARQWEFELHNNGEKIDSSSISDQLVFKAYEGGTEEILPTNGSTPTTSPFKGDIKYPQGLLSDQEFLYRESPTEEDGYAKITDIKGNTLVWNQLVQNGNFADSSLWVGQSTTISISNNIANVTLTAKGTYVALRQSIFASVTGHKYFVTATFKSAKKTAVGFYFNGQGAYLDGYDIQSNTLTKVSALINGGESGGFNIYVSRKNELDVGDVVQVSNVMLFDLTQMGLDISSTSEFTSLFSLPYYSYNQGTLLSFMGSGIKTVGKNLVFKTIPNSSISGSGQIISATGFQMSVAPVIEGEEYVITTNDNSKKVLGFYYEEPVVGSVSYNGERVDDSSSYTFTSPITGYVAFRSLGGYSTPMLEFGSVASDYEPYTSSTLSLPISTYFPNGMKSAGTVYDELTSSKAIQRVKALDLGSINWAGNASIGVFQIAVPLSDAPVEPQITFTKFTNFVDPFTYANAPNYPDGTIGVNPYNSTIYVKDTRYASFDAIKADLSGVYLYYELATPTETSFTTASLVTENAEIPLSNEDGVLIGKCTEELSAEPGFIDAKIKLTDSDGTCYSNKLQFHVERSPQ